MSSRSYGTLPSEFYTDNAGFPRSIRSVAYDGFSSSQTHGSRSLPPPLQPRSTSSYHPPGPSFLAAKASSPLLPSFALSRNLPAPIPSSEYSYSSYGSSPGAKPRGSFSNAVAGSTFSGSCVPRAPTAGPLDSGNRRRMPSYTSGRSVGYDYGAGSGLRLPPMQTRPAPTHGGGPRSSGGAPSYRPESPGVRPRTHTGLFSPRGKSYSDQPKYGGGYASTPDARAGLAPMARPKSPGVGYGSSYSGLPAYDSSTSGYSSSSRPFPPFPTSGRASPSPRPRTPPPKSATRRNFSQVDPESPASSRLHSPVAGLPREPLPSARNVRFRSAAYGSDPGSVPASYDEGDYDKESMFDDDGADWRPPPVRGGPSGNGTRVLNPAKKGQVFTTASASSILEYSRRKAYMPAELNVLQAAWDAGHYYPASSLVEQIIQATELSRPQIRGWFANRRQRAPEDEKARIRASAQRLAVAGVMF